LVAAISGTNSKTDSERSADGLSTSDGVAAWVVTTVVEESLVNGIVLPRLASVLLPLGVPGESLSSNAGGIKSSPSDGTSSVSSYTRVGDASSFNLEVRSNVNGRGFTPASLRLSTLRRVRSNSDLDVLAVAETEIFLESFVRNGAGSFISLLSGFASALVEGGPFSVVSSRDVPLNSACSVLISGHLPFNLDTVQVSGGGGGSNSWCDPEGSSCGANRAAAFVGSRCGAAVGGWFAAARAAAAAAPATRAFAAPAARALKASSFVLVCVDCNGRDKDVSSAEVSVAVHDVEGNESTPKEEHDDSREDSGNAGSTEFSSNDQASEAEDHEADDRGSQE
jgi:hypothetical protein